MIYKIFLFSADRVYESLDDRNFSLVNSKIEKSMEKEISQYSLKKIVM